MGSRGRRVSDLFERKPAWCARVLESSKSLSPEPEALRFWRLKV